ANRFPKGVNCATANGGTASGRRASGRRTSGRTPNGERRRQKDERPQMRSIWGRSKRCRRRPTLPRSLERSTIGAVGLNDRVRNGNECGPYALVASDLSSRE